MRENEKAVDSIKGKLNQFKGAWEELSKNLLNSDLVKFVVDLGTALLKLANNDVVRVVIQITLLTTAINTLKNVLSAVWKITAIGKTLSTATAGVTGLSGAFSLLGKVIKSNPLFFGIGLLAGVVALYKHFEKLKTATKDAAITANEEYKKVVTELKNVNSELETTGNRIDELNKKDKLTATEKDELKNLKEQNRQLLLRKKLVEEQEIKAKTEKEKTAQKVIDDAGNKTITTKGFTSSEYRVDTKPYQNILKKFSPPGAKPYENNVENVTTTEEYIKKLEELREKLGNNQLAVAEIDEEITRVINDSQKWSQTEIDTQTTVKDALEGNIDRYQQTEKAMKTNEEIAQSYREQINKIEEAHKDWSKIYAKGETPTAFSSDEEKKQWENYKRIKDYLKEINNEQMGYQKILNQSKENLEQVAGVYEDMLKDDSLELNSEQLLQIRDTLEQIYDIIDPEKSKTMKFEDIMTRDGMQNVVQELSNLTSAGELNADQVNELCKKYKQFDEVLKNSGLTSQEFADQYNNMTEDTKNGIDSLQSVMTSWEDKMTSLQNKFDLLKQAVDDYNQNGFITAELYEKLLNSGLIDYLDIENGKLVANTGELINQANAYKLLKAQELQAAFTKDLMAIATGNLTEASIYAKNIMEQEGIGAENLGEQAKNGAKGIFTLAWAQEYLAKKGIDAKEKEKEIQKLVNVYSKAFNFLDNTSVGKGTKYTGSKSSSTKEWWEKELDTIKEQFSNSEITIDEYINKLYSLLGRVKQGSDAWKEINKELQKQRLSKVEDDYKRGTISLDEYIKKLKELLLAYRQGTDAWNNLADKIKSALKTQLNERKSDLASAKDAATSIIDDEIKRLEELQQAEEDRYDKLIEEKEKANDETEREIELAKLQEALENAKKEKTKRVYRTGLGWVWEQDQQAIKDAQEALDKFNRDQEISDLEEKKDAASKKYQDQIDALEKYKDAWSDVADDYELAQKRMQLAQQLGTDAEKNLLNDRLTYLEEYKKKYLETMRELEKLEKSPYVGVNDPTTPTTSGGGVTGTTSSGTTYTVQRGDTLSGIASKYGLTWQKIYEANKGVIGGNPSLIYAGQRLTIPGYSSGGVVDYTGLAMLHGSKTKPEFVLNSEQMKKVVGAVLNPATKNLQSSGSQNVTTYNFGDISLPNVTNAKQFVTELASLVNITKHQ